MATDPPTARELRDRAEALLEHVRASTPSPVQNAVDRLSLVVDQLHVDNGLPPRNAPDGRPRLTLIHGGLDDA